MRAAIVLCAFLLSACAVKPEQSAPTRVHSFYSTYLMSLTSSDHQYSLSDLREYVSADTLKRLEDIESISEQDLIGSDYFAYAQDYDPSWISALTVGAARPFMGGEVMSVWIGREGGKKLELEVFVRRESDIWKIYRVRDVTDNYEHPIFNAGAIARAKSAAQGGL
ncbi:YbjP/YqhG family protein [Cronobacter sakazakii]|uniref:YbjP/YqhG family protein n=1 Tax=Cronobacter sakazakii TaxID=28141 RepID=UPI000CFD2696|nr:YbjP/YqhG family protein [Cronobacter sakazakii]ELY4871592.1 YbjP/YqhG family protein [Cronobacter sakazakii]ELY6267394.1 YbjP/YqhG family protein [Cronobacter sakazakii]